MERPAMTSILVALVSFASMFVTGDACDQVPSMTWNDACVQSCNYSQAWVQLCQDTLVNAPPTAELTVFAIIATKQAELMYESSLGMTDQMLGPGTLPADLRSAVDLCKEKYGEATGKFANIVDQMSACDFGPVRREYLDAQYGIVTCQNALWSYQGLPLYSMVSADLDRTMVAYLLGAMIVGK